MRLSSKKYLSGSRGQPCAFRIPGHCNNDPETVVPCHIRDRHKGGGTKASDISVANGCSGCHAAFDQGKLTQEEWLFYALRGLQETLEQRIADGYLIFPHDPVTPANEAPIKPRKPKSQRKAINSRPFPKSQRKFGQ